MPTYTLHRDPRNFVRPLEFIPERWNSQPKLVLNRRAFIPFSIGVANCPGKDLAMMELRDVVARTLFEFDVSFAEKVENFDMEEFMCGTQDHFIAKVPRVELVLGERKRG